MPIPTEKDSYIHLSKLMPPLLNEEFNLFYLTIPGVSGHYIVSIGKTPLGFSTKTMLTKVITKLYKTFPDGTVNTNMIELKPFPKLSPESGPVVSRRGGLTITPAVFFYLDSLQAFLGDLESEEVIQIYAALEEDKEKDALELTKRAFNMYNNNDFEDVVKAVFARLKLRFIKTKKAKTGETMFSPSVSEISEGSQDTLAIQNEIPQGYHPKY